MATIWEDIKWQFKIGDVTTRLIFWNIGIFLFCLLPFVGFFRYEFGVFQYPAWLALSSDWRYALTHPWTLLTYAFLHASFMHLLFNMLLLFFAGRLFLTFFSQRQLLGLYLLSAVFSGLMFVLGYFLLGQSSLLVGASAAIMAVLVAVTIYMPTMEVRLWGVIRMKLWHLTAILLVLDIMFVLVENTGGHIAHLSGAFFGYLYVKLLQNGTDLSNIVASIVGIFDRKPKARMKTVHRNPTRTSQKTASRIVIKDKTQQQIDEILDKIGRSGYDSLTSEEKEFLARAGKD